jgi:hypothetical protein
VVEELIAAVDHVRRRGLRIAGGVERQRGEDARERRMGDVDRVLAREPLVPGGEMDRLVQRRREDAVRRGDAHHRHEGERGDGGDECPVFLHALR